MQFIGAANSDFVSDCDNFNLDSTNARIGYGDTATIITRRTNTRVAASAAIHSYTANPTVADWSMANHALEFCGDFGDGQVAS